MLIESTEIERERTREGPRERERDRERDREREREASKTIVSEWISVSHSVCGFVSYRILVTKN